MRVSEAGLALIRRTGADGAPEYLAQWNDNWRRFALVGGHREPGESFRACCAREVGEELGLAAGLDFRAAPEPVAPLVEYRALSGSAGVETLYRAELYAVELLTREAVARVDADPANRWLTEPEIRRHVTSADGKSIAAQIETVFTRAGVLPVAEEYDLFVSYAHADDADWFVTGLVAALQAEHREFAREPLRIFFDRSEIRTAQDWEERLLHGLKAAKALLTVLSPAYFASPWCRREYTTFTEHETARAWPGDPLTPVYAVEVPGFDGPGADAKRDWLTRLLRAQYCDLKPWRPDGLAAFRNDNVRERLKAVQQWLTERLGRVERVSGSPTTAPPHNRNFVGRTDDLRRLRESLKDGVVTAVTAVSGIGGIGKTALAAEYTHAFAEVYPGGRFWVPSEGADDLRDLFRSLEAPLGLTFTDDERKDRDRGYLRVRAELERRPGTLVVLDNVSRKELFDPSHLSRYRPDGSRVHILMTAREAPPSDPERLVTAIELDRLAADDGRNLLARYRDLGTSDTEWHAAREIVSALGGHALSLEVAGVYLWRHPEIGYADYRDWLREEGLLSASEGAGRDPQVKLSRHAETVVSRLLAPTLNALSAPERRALEYASLLPAEWVVLPWLRELVSADLPDALVRAKRWLPDPWDVLVGRLKSLQLVVPSKDGRLAKMHRVVRAVVLGRAETEHTTQLNEKLSDLILSRRTVAADEWYQPESRWEIEPLFHLIRDAISEGDKGSALAAVCLAPSLRMWGRFRQAKDVLSKAEPILRAAYGDISMPVAQASDALGLIESELGNTTEARRQTNRAIQIWERLDTDLGQTTQLIVCYANLASIELELNRPWVAERLLMRSITLEEKQTQINRGSLALSYRNLGIVAQYLGKKKYASKLLRRSLDMARQDAPDDPVIAEHLAAVAGIEFQMGSYDEALKLIIEAISIQERILDDGHPRLAVNRYNFAWIALGRDREAAIASARRAYATLLKNPGPEHPHTKMARDWLARNDPNFNPDA